MNRRFPWFLVPALAVSVLLPARAQDLVINEFLAANDGSLLDEDGDPSDWFEVRNTGTTTVSLAGWGVTDDAGFLHKWVFPAVNLSPGGHLVVFASGKDRRIAGSELHTSFNLNADGEFFALVEPDGVTTAWAFAPQFPPQRADISYGLTTEVADLVTEADPADYLVPTDGTLGTTWRSHTFVPGAAWSEGAQGLGFHLAGGESTLPPPIAHLDFNGSTADVTGNGNDGSFEGGASPTYVEGADGVPAGAIYFDGGDYLDVTQTVGLPAYNRPAYTIAMWVNGLPQDDKRVWSEGSGENNSPLFTIGTDAGGSTGAVDIFIRSDSGSTIVNHANSTGIAFDGTWHHIAWVDRSGDAELYIDGVRDATNFDYARQALSIDITSIGCVLRESACCFFDGSIDDVAVWDTALTAEEVAELAAGGSLAGGNPYAGSIATDLAADLHDVNASLYLRWPFDLTDASRFDTLSLSVKYDDGFVAFLNGVEIARRNATGASPAWNAAATASRDPSAARVFETINVTPQVGSLRSGQNVLAVHALNESAGDPDFLVAVALTAAANTGLEPRYFAPPTPGAPNGSGFIDFVADTQFSVDRGFYDTPFQVEITTATPGATIRYTTDQEWPTATTGTVYSGPILIDRTTTLRAAAFRSGFQPSNVDTQTYLFTAGIIRQPNNPPGYPSSWAGLPADYAMDPEICTDQGSPDYVATIEEDLKSLPIISLVLTKDDLMGPTRGIYTNPQSRGSAWERPGSMEIFYPDGSKDDIQVNCGIRMQGGSSARPIESKHSFRVLFKGIYGPTRLRHELFGDSEVDEFDTLVLRCFSTDSWHFKDGGARYRRWDSQFIRDVFMKDSQLDMGSLSGHNTYIHLYVNGLYWGIFNPSERPDDDFQADHQGGEPEEWDVIKDFNEVFRGNSQAWNATFNLANAGLGTTEAYQRIQGNNPDGSRNAAYPVYLDVANLIDYMILHLYGCSEDWPHHNWYGARNRIGDLGGWKFFVWDQEIVMDFVYRNRISVNNNFTPAGLYAQARANAEFRMQFADHVQRHFFHDGALTTEKARERWLERSDEIDSAVNGEAARWGDFREDVPDPSNSPAELYTRERHWLVEKEKVLDEYIPESHRLAIERFRAGALFPDVDAPEFNLHGGRIEPGFALSISAPQGTIYYTLDGSDPRLPGGEISPDALLAGAGSTTTLVASGAPCRVLVPAGPVAGDWTSVGFADDAWRSTTTGVGFERTSGFEDLLGEDLGAELDGINATAFIRIPFEVTDPTELTSLTLRMKYDDGFIAYLNGTRVADANPPATPAWNSEASGPHADSDALIFENFDLDAWISELQAGTNVLAIHGMNSSAASSDMLILPELIGIGAADGGGGIQLGETTWVRTRALGGEWSALNEALFYIDIPLRITEIMYHPRASGAGSLFGQDEFEFVELYNAGTAALDLDGFRLAGGIDFEFEPGTRLLPGELILVVENLNAFLERYPFLGVAIAGQYSRKLANDADEILVEGPSGETLLAVRYSDTWQPPTDGEGYSLVINDPHAEPETWGDAASWTSSGAVDGSPGFLEGNPPVGGWQRPGDVNQDAVLDLSDAVSLLFILFPKQAQSLPCGGSDPLGGGNRDVLDINQDLVVNLTDALYLLNFLFLEGPPPVAGLQCRRVEGCPDACF